MLRTRQCTSQDWVWKSVVISSLSYLLQVPGESQKSSVFPRQDEEFPASSSDHLPLFITVFFISSIVVSTSKYTSIPSTSFEGGKLVHTCSELKYIWTFFPKWSEQGIFYTVQSFLLWRSFACRNKCCDTLYDLLEWKRESLAVSTFTIVPLSFTLPFLWWYGAHEKGKSKSRSRDPNNQPQGLKWWNVPLCRVTVVTYNTSWRCCILFYPHWKRLASRYIILPSQEFPTWGNDLFVS